MNKQDQQNQQGGKQSMGKTQSELETILRSGDFKSQSSLNSYLQPHGLTGQINEDGTAVIWDESSGKRQQVATVQFAGTGEGQRQVSGINY